MKNGRSWLDFLPEEAHLKAVFEHARNIVTATLIIAAGAYVMGNPLDHKLALIPSLPGIVTALMGVALLLLNFLDGLRRLYRLRIHVLLQTLLFVGYFVFSWRLVQIMLAFQRHS